MRTIGRLVNLIRGAFARWMGRREQRNPDAVYEAAIQERLERYVKLRQAAAGVLYLRGKLAAQLERESAELARLGRQLDLAVARDDDPAALALIRRRDGLAADVRRLESELTQLTREAEGAKDNLVTFQDEIAHLRDERVRTLARLASAQARLRFHETLAGFSTAADVRALEEVRDHVERLVAETQLAFEAEDGDLARRLDHIREAEAETGARAQLEELKRTRRAELPAPPLGLPAAAR